MADKRDPFPDVLDMRQVAAKLGKSHSWLKGYIREHPCGRKVGAKRVFTPADYAALLASFPTDYPPAYKPHPQRTGKNWPRVSSMSGKQAFDQLMASLAEPKRRGSNTGGDA